MTSQPLLHSHSLLLRRCERVRSKRALTR